MSFKVGERIAYRDRGEWHPGVVEQVKPDTSWTRFTWDYLLRLDFGIDGEDGVYAHGSSVFPEKVMQS